MDIVLVEFAVGPENTEACATAVEKLTREFVARQPAFHGATIHIEKQTGTVWNYMKWDTCQDFITFRDSNMDRIGPALGEFGPAGKMLTIAAEVAADHA